MQNVLCKSERKSNKAENRMMQCGLTRSSVSKNCTGTGPGGIWEGGTATGRLEVWVILLISTTAEANRAVAEAVYTCPGLDDKVLVSWAAAAAAAWMPAVLGNVTSVFNRTLSTCSGAAIGLQWRALLPQLLPPCYPNVTPILPPCLDMTESKGTRRQLGCVS